jgi:signal transduction protein with GAF and PtsI domain
MPEILTIETNENLPSLPTQSRELNLLHRISEVMSYDLSLSELLQFIVGVTADLMGSKIVSVLLYDEETRSLSIAATQSLSGAYRDKPPVNVDRSVSGRAILAKRPMAVTDIQTDPSYGYKEIARKEGIMSLLCVPMVVRGQAIGTINSYSASVRGYSEDDIKLLSLVASQVAAAVENSRLQSAAAAFAEDLAGRKSIAKAKALLIQKRRMDEPAAHRFLQKESMNRRKPMRAIAEALILSEDLSEKS